MQVGLVKKYSDAEAVSGLLNLVKMELGLGTDVGFTQVTQTIVKRVVCLAYSKCWPNLDNGLSSPKGWIHTGLSQWVLLSTIFAAFLFVICFVYTLPACDGHLSLNCSAD